MAHCCYSMVGHSPKQMGRVADNSQDIFGRKRTCIITHLCIAGDTFHPRKRGVAGDRVCSADVETLRRLVSACVALLSSWFWRSVVYAWSHREGRRLKRSQGIQKPVDPSKSSAIDARTSDRERGQVAQLNELETPTRGTVRLGTNIPM